MALPRCQFWSFYSEFLTPYSNRTCKDTGHLPSLFFVFLASFDRFCIFCFLDRSYLFRKKKKKERQAASVSIRAWTTPCQNFKRFNIFLHGYYIDVIACISLTRVTFRLWIATPKRDYLYTDKLLYQRYHTEVRKKRQVSQERNDYKNDRTPVRSPASAAAAASNYVVVVVARTLSVSRRTTSYYTRSSFL